MLIHNKQRIINMQIQKYISIIVVFLMLGQIGAGLIHRQCCHTDQMQEKKNKHCCKMSEPESASQQSASCSSDMNLQSNCGCNHAITHDISTPLEITPMKVLVSVKTYKILPFTDEIKTNLYNTTITENSHNNPIFLLNAVFLI